MDRMKPHTRENLSSYAYGFCTGLLVHILVVFILKYLGTFLGFEASASCSQGGLARGAIEMSFLAALLIYGPLGLLAGLRAERVNLPTGFSSNPRTNAAITVAAVFALLVGALQGLLVFNSCYFGG